MCWRPMCGFVLACLAATVSAGEEFTLSAVEQLPEGLNEKVAAMLAPSGMRITGSDGPVCTIWLAKTLPAKAKFKPSLTVRYPLTPGQLVGALEVHAQSFSDFRAQPVKPGVYTLRYGLQPQDGNHVGTSEVSDFLLAVPAASDADPALVKVPALMKRSAKATGSNHPAIYSLLPAEAAADEPQLVHDEAKELWILHVAGTGDGETKVPFRLVVIGKSEG